MKFCGIRQITVTKGFTASVEATVLYNEFENHAFEITAHLPGAIELMIANQCSHKVDLFYMQKTQYFIFSSKSLTIDAP